MFNTADKNYSRKKRHQRIRKKLSGSPDRLRLTVFRSHKNIAFQLVNDLEAKTLFAASTEQKDFKASGSVKSGGNKAAAKALGLFASKKMLSQGFKQIAFDRGGYLYHGRIKELADGLREGGIQF